jgi:hypothetical protein
VGEGKLLVEQGMPLVEEIPPLVKKAAMPLVVKVVSLAEETLPLVVEARPLVEGRQLVEVVVHLPFSPAYCRCCSRWDSAFVTSRRLLLLIVRLEE